MLEQVLNEIHNWFQRGIVPGTYTIKDGSIALPFLQNGQYFRIVGSLFNDGLHLYGPAMELLHDETFDGAVWALAVPKVIQDIAKDAAKWHVKNGFIVENPYVAESFGGYNVTYRTDISGWQDVFRARLNPYRKLREI